MLKPRYIIILIILFVTISAVVGIGLEMLLVSKAANTASTMVQIAANAALNSATMSDEFFTRQINNGGGTVRTAVGNLRQQIGDAAGTDAYISSDNLGFAYATTANGAFNRTESVYTIAWENEIGTGASAEAIYKATFNANTHYQNWLKNVLQQELAKPSRKIRWSDTIMQTDSTGRPRSIYVSGAFEIPRVMSMGGETINDAATGNATAIVQSFTDHSDTPTIRGGTLTAVPIIKYRDTKSVLRKDKIDKGIDISSLPYGEYSMVLSDTGLWNSRRITTAYKPVQTDATDWTHSTAVATDELEYFITPSALGLTYIDPVILDILFRTNMDLLMRAGYLDAPVAGSNAYTVSDTYADNIENEYYPNEGMSAYGEYVCNNSDFYYVRGQYSPAQHCYVLADGTQLPQPDIEYIYLYPTETSEANTIDADPHIRNIMSRAINPTFNLSSFFDKNKDYQESYELIIAKVTFYADFVVPYKTREVRGMARDFGTLVGSNQDAPEQSEAGMRAFELNAGVVNEMGNTYLGTTYSTEIVNAGSPINEKVTKANANTFIENSQRFVYTTYYAITP